MPRKKTKTSVNHIFEKVLVELRDEALAAKKMYQYYNFCKAVKAVRGYPFVLDVKLCEDLPGFGKYTFSKFQERLMENYENVFNEEGDDDWDILGPGSPTAHRNSWTAPTPTRRRRGTNARGGKTNTPRRQLNKKKEYSPKVGTGAYAILITMLREKERFNYRGFSTKQELIDKGSSLCRASMTTSTKVDFRCKYTAWHGVRTLQKHELVFTISGRPEKFKLSEKGVELARKLLQKHKDPTYRFQAYANSPAPCSSISSPCPVSYNYGSSSSEVGEDDVIDFDNISESDLAAFLNDACSQNTIPGNSSDSNRSFSCHDEDGFCVVTNPADNDSKMIVDVSDEQPEPDYAPDAVSESDVLDDQQLIFQSGDFEIFLIVDNAEAQDRSKRVTKSTPETIRELTIFGMKDKFEVRRLELGDFLWVARHKITRRELVLPYIIERKRMDDLAESIRDGRYQEQKFRLRKCGLPNVIYLVEKFGDDDTEFADLSPATLRQAIVNTAVTDGFFVKRTSSHKNTMYYLATLTTLVTCIFKEKLLVSCRRHELPSYNIEDDMASLMTYEEFSSLSRKNKCLSIRDLFMKQLIQMKSLSVQKASAIVQNYETVRRLREAFNCAEPESLISRLTLEENGPGTNENVNQKRPIGPAASKAIFRLFTDRSLK